MIRIRCIRAGAFIAVAGFLFGNPGFAQAPNPPAGLPDAQQIISYLNQTIDWYRHLTVEEQIAGDPADVLFLNDDRQLARQIVRLSFDFAKARAQTASEATQSTTQPQNGPPSRYQTLLQSAAQTDAQVKETQQEIAAVRQKLLNARGTTRAELQSTLDELQSELNLAQARSETVHNLLQFVGTSGTSGTENLMAQIEELQRAVPELAASNQKSSEQEAPVTSPVAANTAPAATASVTPQRHETPSGILGLITDLFSLTRKIHALDQTIDLTDSFEQSSKTLRAPFVASLTTALQKADALAKQADTSDTAGLQQEKQQLDALTQQFRQLSTVVLPLGKQSILLDAYRNSLLRWRDTVKSQYEVELKSLSLRLSILIIVLAVFLTLSEIWRRATFKYVTDVRRRYQFLLLRRVVMWLVIGITIAFALATEIGSLATFAGLITAGIAVALQNVILSVAAYFFLIGKYGVRAGDRVQISGVTGQVVDVGLVRIHLMELGGSGNNLQPTGRIVVFSNSVVFQPTASFYKQIPGTNFVWHEVTLTLAPETDYRLAETRMLGAVEKVYSKYRERIEQQHQQMQRNLNLSVPVPKPQSRLHLTQAGLEVVIRYPLELDKATEVDDQITRELLIALQQKPKLRLVGTGTPNIQPVSDGSAATEQPSGIATIEK